MATQLQKDPLFSADNLIWVDMEMTGLRPEVNRVIEVAAVITDMTQCDPRVPGDRRASERARDGRDGRLEHGNPWPLGSH